VSDDDLTRIYIIPINVLEVYFLAIFTQILRLIFTQTLDCIQCLPAPTADLEIKFASILSVLDTSSVHLFRSYTHKASLFYFTFTQAKLFVLFFVSLFPIFPTDVIRDNSVYIIPWLCFGASLVFAIVQIVSRPYVSILHNLVNFVGYAVAAIAAMLSALLVMGTDVPSAVGDIFTVLIFVAPIVAAVIVPFFANKSRGLKPITYEVRDVLRGDAYLRARAGKTDESDSEASPPEVELDDINAKDMGHAVMSLDQYMPILVQMGISSGGSEAVLSKPIWHSNDVVPWLINAATREMLILSNRVLDCISFNRLVTLMNVSVIFVSACLGWGLGAGTAIWKKGSGNTTEALDWYLRCNMVGGDEYTIG
jgi:hypothetical protein